ncbi:MAG: hypothetical protein ABJC74_07850 [Gemmatimonadota bacterium]
MSTTDFDFLIGTWTVAHRRLTHRLVGSTDWEEFAGSSVCRKILDGAGNLEELVMPAKGYTGATLRLYDPAQQQWSLYWASGLTGLLYPPVVGRFEAGQGQFYGNDTEAGQPVRARFRWTPKTPTSAHWDQAFSTDGGTSWETNWEMRFARA